VKHIDRMCGKLILVQMLVLAVPLALDCRVFGQARLTGQGGTLRDASTMIGSGGYNSPVRRDIRYRSGYGNLFITGNISAGKSFRGLVPYSDPTQFQGPLGTSTLSNFRRDTVGLGTLSGPGGSTSWQALPYYNPSSTVLPLSAQARGLTLPGGSAPKSAFIPAGKLGAGIRLSRGAIEAPAPMPSLLRGVRPEDILVPSMPAGLEAWLPPSQGQELQAIQPPELARHLADTTIRSIEPLPDNQSQSMIAPQIITRGLPEPAQDQQGPMDQERYDRFQAVPEPPTEQQTEQPAESMRDRRAEKWESAQLIALEAKLGTAGLADQIGQAVRAAEQRAQQGQQFLRRGQYYRAAQAYEQAGQLDQDDPLPLLGQTNALLAAGQYRRAAQVFGALLDMFDRDVELQLDAAIWPGSMDVLDNRRLELQGITITCPQDPAPLLLRGYIELLEGNRSAAGQLFEQAAGKAPQDQALARIARQIKSQPTTQPAK